MISIISPFARSPTGSPIHIQKNAPPGDPSLASQSRVAYPVQARATTSRSRNNGRESVGDYSTIRRDSTKISNKGPKILPTPDRATVNMGPNCRPPARCPIRIESVSHSGKDAM